MIPFLILAIEDPSDREFMANIYLQYHRLMYSEIYAMLEDRWATEDVMQIVLERLIDKIALLKTLDHSRTANYIITASKNNALNYIRDNKKHGDYAFDESFDSLSEDYVAVDDRLSLAEQMESVKEAWQQLDERNRRLLEMKYILEYSDDVIAKEMNVAKSSLRMMLTRARNQLKKLMKDSEMA